MKKLITSISVIFVLIFLVTPTVFSINASTPDPSYLSVKGKGIVYVDPDTATINFCIETRAKTKEEAIKENDAIAKKIKEALKKWGSVSDESFYSYDDMCNRMYVCTRCMSLCTDKVDNISEITAKIGDLGATSINYVSYGIKDYKPHREKAFRLAIEDAENKAAKIAHDMELKSIIELGEPPYCGYYEATPLNCRKKVPVECNVMIIYISEP